MCGGFSQGGPMRILRSVARGVFFGTWTLVTIGRAVIAHRLDSRAAPRRGRNEAATDRKRPRRSSPAM
jgi:hypothetical protein